MDITGYSWQLLTTSTSACGHNTPSIERYRISEHIQIGNKYDQVNKVVPRLSNILIYFATADIAGMKSFFRDICPSTRIYPC